MLTPPTDNLPPNVDKHRAIAYLPLNAAPHRWLGMGYTKEWGYTEEPAPKMIPICGLEGARYELIPVCRMVAKIAGCGTPDVWLNWQYVADWLNAGATPDVIRQAIERQVKSMVARGTYNGVHTLKLFNRSVMDATEIEKIKGKT